MIWAGNHHPPACDTYRRNHVSATVTCQDLQQFDWRNLPEHDVLLAAPSCQPHSEASQPGRRAYHDPMRTLPLAVVGAVEVARPKAWVVENVPQFVEWELYGLWVNMFERLGYRVTAGVVRASKLGVPQRRDRLFVCGSLKRPVNLDVPDAVEPPFSPCIQWSEGDWRPIKSCRGENARVRLETASRRFGGQALVQHVTGHGGVSPSEPIRTVTTKDQWCVVKGARYRPFTLREYARAMDFPDTFSWDPSFPRTEVVRGLGNGVCRRVGKFIVQRVLDAA